MQSNARYNVFNLIHKALRGLMYDVAVAIQRTDFSDAEASGTIARLEQLLAFFDEHADHEDDHILTHVAQYEAALVDAFEQDHVLDRRLTQALHAHIESWHHAATATEKSAAGLRIFYAFNEFIAFNLSHMNREENELLPAMWKHFSDDEILAMHHSILQEVTPDVMHVEGLWMLRMSSLPELAGWLRGVRAAAPPEVFGGLMQQAQAELSEVRFDVLAALLDAAPAMA